ncbi:MAG TPA: hypothetical protein VKT74_06355 [Gammaproteobacteria bacterium]|nr:hypothetical protein [Gammaproteobacteria bacterium]
MALLINAHPQIFAPILIVVFVIAGFVSRKTQARSFAGIFEFCIAIIIGIGWVDLIIRDSVTGAIFSAMFGVLATTALIIYLRKSKSKKKQTTQV